MSIDAFDEREKILKHREAILEAELSRVSGEKTYSLSEMREHLREIYSNGKV